MKLVFNYLECITEHYHGTNRFRENILICAIYYAFCQPEVYYYYYYYLFICFSGWDFLFVCVLETMSQGQCPVSIYQRLKWRCGCAGEKIELFDEFLSWLRAAAAAARIRNVFLYRQAVLMRRRMCHRRRTSTPTSASSIKNFLFFLAI